MNEYAADQGVAGQRKSDLVDVSLLEFQELMSSNDSVLANALRRILQDVDRSADAISGWSSYAQSEEADDDSPGSLGGSDPSAPPA